MILDPRRVGRDADEEDPAETLRRIAMEVMRRNPGASLDELNAVMQLEQDRYNARPQAALGGLSPDRVLRLELDEWDNESVLHLRDDLPAAELEAAPFLHDALLLLDQLAREPVRLTKTGNLPRAVVAEHVARMRTPEYWPGLFAHVRNERDLMPLHHLRILLTVAGLVRKLRGELRVTRRGRELSAPERRGALYVLLFRTWFREFNLAYVDRAASAPGLQAMIAFTLYRFRELAGKWRTTAELTRLCILPSERAELPVVRVGAADDPNGLTLDEAAVPLETRFLRPLVRFGLARTEDPPAPLKFDRRRWRKTPLLDRFVRFEW